MYYNWTKDTNTEELKIVCNLIKNGELVIFPTETVYGIGANALDSNAVNKIFIAKGRPSDNPLIVHIANKSDIDKIAKDITKMEKKLINSFMPGPFTIILKRKELEGKVSAIVDGGKSNIGLESTVVKVVDEVPVILRPGKVTPEQIEKTVGKVVIDSNVFAKPKKDTKVESPGMKYRHYAPNTKCKLFYAKDEKDLIFEINKQIRIYNNVVVLGFKEHKDKINVKENNYIEVSSKDNIEEYAKNIYTDLRKADNLNANVILIEGVEKKSFGIAIMNRLLRTCEYDYKEL